MLEQSEKLRNRPVPMNRPNYREDDWMSHRNFYSKRSIAGLQLLSAGFVTGLLEEIRHRLCSTQGRPVAVVAMSIEDTEGFPAAGPQLFRV